MTALFDAIASGAIVTGHRPWLRAVVDAETWTALAAQLAAGRWTLLSLWGEADAVQMALLDEEAGTVAVATLPCPDGAYPSVGRLHAPAQRLERAARDLFGLVATDAPDVRPWLDHGRWGLSHPLAAGGPGVAQSAPYAFLSAEGEGLHQVAVGPVHAGIIEPGHFRFTANGEAVVRLEERLGYVHRGLDGLMAGAALERGAALAGRVSGDSTVAYGLAFARAVEAALQVEVPPRAIWQRGVMAELERLANHVGDIGAICNDAAFPRLLAPCAVLREQVLRAAQLAFGHRLMMDGVIPGGVATALSPEGASAIRAVRDIVGKALPGLMALYDGTASLQDRTVGTGRAHPDLVRRFGCAGVVGRASGRGFDVRRTLPYAPYDQLAFDVPALHEGDVNARVWIRFREVEQSLSLIGQMLDRVPTDGPLTVDLGAQESGPCEGLALVEGFRGDVLAFVRLDRALRIARCHLRDPSWFHWPVLEAAIEGNIIADFPLINKSFNCSYAGQDL
ncbi:NADH-quinone oxidoreductase subunit C [Azorhizobium sp. AG788]|uniref:hydrogenase large subunit n=1 Tax=Azorhizobium sp. AG788 TaxID=2183897 RepID=UPI0031394F7E